jgi:hypothetical protein
MLAAWCTWDQVQESQHSPWGTERNRYGRALGMQKEKTEQGVDETHHPPLSVSRKLQELVLKSEDKENFRNVPLLPSS